MWITRFCVTKGALLAGGVVNVPTFRAVAPGTSGDDVTLDFIYRGGSSATRALASGGTRRQIGLKLRAQDGCNLVYLMWRLDPRPQLEASIKLNPGARTHAECGARGYTKLTASFRANVPELRPSGRHQLRAAIVGDDLSAWIDGHLAWRGPLPFAARSLRGPVGVRSDNLAYEVVSLWATAGHSDARLPKCLIDGED